MSNNNILKSHLVIILLYSKNITASKKPSAKGNIKWLPRFVFTVQSRRSFPVSCSSKGSNSNIILQCILQSYPMRFSDARQLRTGALSTSKHRGGNRVYSSSVIPRLFCLGWMARGRFWRSVSNDLFLYFNYPQMN